jgi:hypothetical protein
MTTAYKDGFFRLKPAQTGTLFSFEKSEISNVSLRSNPDK